MLTIVGKSATDNKEGQQLACSSSSALTTAVSAEKVAQQQKVFSYAPSFTLRQDKADINCVAVFHNNNNNNTAPRKVTTSTTEEEGSASSDDDDDDDDDDSLNIPLLVTGDGSGQVVMWDLLTRRRFLSFRPYESDALVQRAANHPHIRAVLACGFLSTPSSCNNNNHWIYFWTQGRCQLVSLWRVSLLEVDEKRRVPELLRGAQIVVPQMGFCRAWVTNLGLGKNTTCCDSHFLVAVPSDNEGKVLLHTVIDVASSGACLPDEDGKSYHPASSTTTVSVASAINVTSSSAVRCGQLMMLKASDLRYNNENKGREEGSENCLFADFTVVASFESGHVCVCIVGAEFPSTSSQQNNNNNNKNSSANNKVVFRVLSIVAEMNMFSEPATASCLSSSGRLLSAASAEGEVQVYALARRTTAMSTTAAEEDEARQEQQEDVDAKPVWATKLAKGVADVALRSDEQLLLCACWDGNVRMYDARCGTLLSILDVHAAQTSSSGGVQSVIFDPADPAVFFTVASDATIAAWHYDDECAS